VFPKDKSHGIPMRRLGKVRFRGAWGGVKGSGGGSLGRRGNIYIIDTVSASTNAEHVSPSASTNIYITCLLYMQFLQLLMLSMHHLLFRLVPSR
jgi:hypothetical protein